MSRSANGGFGGGEAPVIGDRPLLADSGSSDDGAVYGRDRATTGQLGGGVVFPEAASRSGARPNAVRSRITFLVD